MKSYQMEVSKKENGAYVAQGKIEVFYPLLNELGLNVEAEKVDDEGFLSTVMRKSNTSLMRFSQQSKHKPVISWFPVLLISNPA